MFMTGLMGVSLASYLIFVRNQNLSVMRSLAWNTCIPVVEAGVEEAMTHLNRSGVTNLALANWTLGANGYSKTRYLGDSYYVVTISTNDPPTISSQGFVPVPVNPTVAMGFLATVGLDGNGATRFNGRNVRVTTKKDGLWMHAMVAKSTINLNGNNIATDSFDSGDPNYSTGGQYDSTKHKANGDVATDSTIINSLNVGDADIWGHASTGPGGSISIGPNGSIGDLAWHNANNGGIQPGSTNNDMNVYLPDVTQPFSTGFSPQSGTLYGQSYTYLLDGGATGTDYVISDLSLNGHDTMMVTNHVRLLVTGSINITGNAGIEVAKNSSLEIYMKGTSASIGGNGVANDTGYAVNFLYFGLPTNTSLSFSGNGTFTGAIYAPAASFNLGGGGSGSQDFIGASVSNTVLMNGHFLFHFDEALGRSKWARGYLVDSWNEL
jgi:hypothetical protein